MEYIKLLLGIALLAAFTWILIRNSKRTGILQALLRIETVVGMVAGFYLITTAINSLMLL